MYRLGKQYLYSNSTMVPFNWWQSCICHVSFNPTHLDFDWLNQSEHVKKLSKKMIKLIRMKFVNCWQVSMVSCFTFIIGKFTLVRIHRVLFLVLKLFPVLFRPFRRNSWLQSANWTNMANQMKARPRSGLKGILSSGWNNFICRITDHSLHPCLDLF